MTDGTRQRDRQSELPFAEAEGSFAERKELLGLALMKAQATLYEAQFMLWLFNVTDGGMRGRLTKSYTELAARPWGLCCHPNQAAATVKKCQERGWVSVHPTRLRPGVQGPNEYGLLWDGIKRTLLIQLSPASARPPPRKPPHTECEAPHTTCEAPHTTCEAPHTTCDPIGITPFRTPEIHSGTGTGTGRPPPEPVRTPADLFSAGWFVDCPELAAAAAGRVAPLPAGELVYGAFRVLDLDHLRKAGPLVLWFRRQLATARPLTGDSQAELLLVLAAGRHALALPASEVRKTRVAVFCSLVGGGKWLPVLGHVPRARQTLDQLLAEWPECLTHPDGEGPRASAASGGERSVAISEEVAT